MGCWRGGFPRIACADRDLAEPIDAPTLFAFAARYRSRIFMATISEALDAAVKFHQSGDLAAAEHAVSSRSSSATPGMPTPGTCWDWWPTRSGDFATAAEQMGRAVDLDPAQPTFHNHLAEAFRSLGRLSEAEASCRRALELQGDLAIAHNTLGTVFACARRPEQAMLCYRRAIALKSDFAQAHLNLGQAYECAGQLDEAIGSYRQALAAKPDYALAYEKLR